jgi:hypothetical protein
METPTPAEGEGKFTSPSKRVSFHGDLPLPPNMGSSAATSNTVQELLRQIAELKLENQKRSEQLLMYQSKPEPVLYVDTGGHYAEEYLEGTRKVEGTKKKRRKSPRRGRRKSPSRSSQNRSVVSSKKNSVENVRQSRQRERRVSITPEEFHRSLRGGSPDSPHCRVSRRSASPVRQKSASKGQTHHLGSSVKQDAERRFSGMRFNGGGRSSFDLPPPPLPNQRSRSRGRSSRFKVTSRSPLT